MELKKNKILAKSKKKLTASAGYLVPAIVGARTLYQ
jgi:hypothetical protein